MWCGRRRAGWHPLSPRSLTRPAAFSVRIVRSVVGDLVVVPDGEEGDLCVEVLQPGIAAVLPIPASVVVDRSTVVRGIGLRTDGWALADLVDVVAQMDHEIGRFGQDAAVAVEAGPAPARATRDRESERPRCRRQGPCGSDHPVAARFEDVVVPGSRCETVDHDLARVIPLGRGQHPTAVDPLSVFAPHRPGHRDRRTSGFGDTGPQHHARRCRVAARHPVAEHAVPDQSMPRWLGGAGGRFGARVRSVTRFDHGARIPRRRRTQTDS